MLTDVLIEEATDDARENIMHISAGISLKGIGKPVGDGISLVEECEKSGIFQEESAGRDPCTNIGESINREA